MFIFVSYKYEHVSNVLSKSDCVGKNIPTYSNSFTKDAICLQILVGRSISIRKRGKEAKGKEEKEKRGKEEKGKRRIGEKKKRGKREKKKRRKEEKEKKGKRRKEE